MNRREYLTHIFRSIAPSPALATFSAGAYDNAKPPPTVGLICWGAGAALGSMHIDWLSDFAGRRGNSAGGYGWITRFVLPDLLPDSHCADAYTAQAPFILQRENIGELIRRVDLVVIVATFDREGLPELSLAALVAAISAFKKPMQLTLVASTGGTFEIQSSRDAARTALEFINSRDIRIEMLKSAQGSAFEALKHQFEIAKIVNATLVRGLTETGVTFR
jgi:hypothetical protein